jgi:regulator of protease activity HflC (stomatin/prohibitin superfamily)
MNKKLFTLVLLILCLPLFAFIFFLVFFQKVPIDRVGVRTDQIGGGIEQRDFQPGYVFTIPFKHKLELMDPTYQFYTQAGNTALKLRSSDGFQTLVDVTVVYRIKPGLAHQAIVRHGPGLAFQSKLQTIAEKYLWEVLTELVTEDFYNAEKRLEQSKKAAELMGAQLVNEHLELIDVLIRDIKYDQKYEQLLLEQQLLKQQKLLFDSKKKLEDEKTVTELIVRETKNKVIEIREEQAKEMRELKAKTDAEIAKIRVDAEKYAETKLAEASRESRENIAEGELAVVKAEAEGERAINEAYRTEGGDLLIARKTIENIQLGEIEINTNLTNPFDVKQMLEMVGVSLSDIEAGTGSSK